MIQVDRISYSYNTKYQKIEALKEVSAYFSMGKMYAITGESGSGKSTFLSLLAGLDLPTAGTIYVKGKDIKTMNRDVYRKEQASVVYQSFHLFPLLTALENIMYPMELRGFKRAIAQKEAKLLIEKMGLPNKIWNQFPSMMSGGEQQRVAIARAMATGGKIILADEPTGNLDSKNEKIIVSHLKNLAHTEDYMVIVITHNPMVAEEADEIFRMKDGRFQSGEENDWK